MTDECTNYGSTWVAKFDPDIFDVNGLAREPGYRQKHVCPRCAEEMKALFGWENAKW